MNDKIMGISEDDEFNELYSNHTGEQSEYLETEPTQSLQKSMIELPQQQNNILSNEENKTQNNARNKSKTIIQGKKQKKKKEKASIDNYEFYQDILGEGAFGQVKLGKDKTTGKSVAIKFVNIVKICQLGKEGQVLREKELLQELNHFNIIHLNATFKDNTNLYFVMEHAPNGSLDDLIKKTRGIKDESIIQTIFGQLVNYQEYAMKQGIMHRDLKPQNIMLDANYNVKLIDFGDARRLNEALAEDAEARRYSFVGTVNYQSPEVINSGEQGFALDIWALGCILFKMFTGTVPFKGTNPHKVYADIKTRNIQWPEKAVLDQKISPEGQDLINRMIQIEPEQRLGHNLDSIKSLKQHPFFDGINFSAVSKSDFVGLRPKIDAIMHKLASFAKEESKLSLSLSELHGRNCREEGEMTVFKDRNNCIFKGCLIKKNWYGNKQLRFFELYKYGELKYFTKDYDYKGSITLGPNSKIRKSARTTLSIHCEKKKRDYTIMQPESGQVNFQEQKEQGNCVFLENWLHELNAVVENLKLMQVQTAAVDTQVASFGGEDSSWRN